MKETVRCLYKSDFETFLDKDKEFIFGILCEKYHGAAPTTTREAWIGEIQILKNQLASWKKSNAQIIFEYDIPRLGKRLDTVLLLNGIIFCLEFKVGESKLNEKDVDLTICGNTS